MENPIAFRRSIGGYNRDDVNSYISDTNQRFTALEEEYKKTIKDLHAQIKAQKKEIDDLEFVRSVNESLTEEKAHFDEIIEEKDKAIKERDEKIKQLRKELDALSATLNEATEKIAELSSEPAVYEFEIDDEIIEKAKKYDELDEQVEAIIYEANIRAKQIIEDAKKKAAAELKKKPTQTKKAPKKESGTSLLDELRLAIKHKLQDI